MVRPYGVSRRRLLAGAAGAGLVGAWPFANPSARAADAPAGTRPPGPITLVVPYTPGTGADLLARIIGPELSQHWGVAVITDNRPGASGNIGAELVARAKPDGQTLLVTATAFGTNPALNRKLPFDAVKSFVPVQLLATSSLCLVVSPQLPAKTLREFIELAKKQPGQLTYSSPGPGTPQHLTMELLKQAAGIDILHVPYKGSGGGITDLMGGHVNAMVSAVQTVAPNVQAGQLRMLGVIDDERSSLFPEVPTLKEQGFPSLVVETWYGVMAPAGTPAPIVQAFNAEFERILALPAVRAALAKQGQTPAGGPPARLGNLVVAELARWTQVVDTAKIKAE